MEFCTKHNIEFTQLSPSYAACVPCREETQAILCKSGQHHMAPPRGIDGKRWCYGCGATIDPDDYFAEAVGLLIQKMR